MGMPQDDIDWARANLRDDLKKAYCGVDAAYSAFKIEWGKDSARKNRKLPGRTQFLNKVWKPEANQKQPR
jgi:hypothetical protein